MASPASASLFSELRGVTVRNTFLEFTDVGADTFYDTGFGRQSSEPAKPFHRQLSEQTTAGSGATVEESTTETDEGHSQLSAVPPHRADADQCGSRAPALGPDAALQAAFQAAAGSAAGGAVSSKAKQGQVGAMRFCPNCGVAAEPSHRFCPYCCYPLQQSSADSGSGGSAAAPQRRAAPVEGTVADPSAPSLLAYVRRFRYVEACEADVELARVLCLNCLQAGRAA